MMQQVRGRGERVSINSLEANKFNGETVSGVKQQIRVSMCDGTRWPFTAELLPAAAYLTSTN